jgi:HSP20 family protein
VDKDSIDLTVEKNVLTIHAERRPSIADGTERVVGERTYGVFSRQLLLGDAVDVDHLSADYDAGVVMITIPVAEQAKPRKVEVSSKRDRRVITA